MYTPFVQNNICTEDVLQVQCLSPYHNDGVVLRVWCVVCGDGV